MDALEGGVPPVLPERYGRTGPRSLHSVGSTRTSRQVPLQTSSLLHAAVRIHYGHCWRRNGDARGTRSA